MFKKVFLLIFVGLMSISLSAQDEVNVWKTLGKISYRKEYDELLGFKVDIPVFGTDIKDIAGSEITVKGYMIPVEGYEDHSDFIFSAFPYNMCFFCGGAGPETVMEVQSVKPVPFTAEQIVIRGKLVLNDTDINKLMYRLEEVVVVN